jgi:hypothetical protein
MVEVVLDTSAREVGASGVEAGVFTKVPVVEVEPVPWMFLAATLASIGVL